jgi:butyrate kinase
MDRRTIADGLVKYSSRVTETVTEFIALHKGKPEFTILSGGGLNIAKVAESLKSLMSNGRTEILPGDIDYKAKNEQHLTVLAAEETTRYFGRVATAVGAASIVIGL